MNPFNLEITIISSSIIVCSLLVPVLADTGGGRLNGNPNIDPGKPLFLTPLLESGQVNEARQLSKVYNLSDLKIYSGYFTTDKIYDSNLFFWYFPALFDSENAPLLIWLNGGPGAATMFGLFVENGPIQVDSDGNIDYRSTSWALSHSVLFIDNPVGAGFSFTRDAQGYATTETDVTNGLYNALSQFYQLFPNMKKRDLYITGESYAGKYVPSLAVRIHEKNLLLDSNELEDSIPLKGIAVGDGWVDPISQVTQYGHFLYNLGLLDRTGRKYFEGQESMVANFIRKGKFRQAFEVMHNLIGYSYDPLHNTFNNLTGLHQYYNFLLQTEPKFYTNHVEFLDKNNSTRKSLHVGSQPYTEGSVQAMFALKNDIFRSSKSSVETLLNARVYKILWYNGQLDIIVSPPSVNSFIRNLNWFGAELFANCTKTVWRVKEDIAGYKKTYGNFTHLLIRNAGHIVPYDQPEWALEMIREFIASG